MLLSLRIFGCLCFLFYSTMLFSQTTAELFSIPGLVVGSFIQDDTFQKESAGYSFHEKTISGDTAYILFYTNEGTAYNYLSVIDKKVYAQNPMASNLLYDFDVVIGDTIKTGLYGVDMYDENRGLLICSYTDAPINYRGILKTVDGGTTWEETYEGSQRMVDLTLGENGLAWATGHPNSLHISHDYGDSWSTINYADTILVRQLYPINQDTLLASIWEWEDDTYNRYIGKSEDGGNTWDLKLLPDEINKIEISDPNIIYGYKYFKEGLYKSLDQGSSWELIFSEEITEVKFLNKNEGWISGVVGDLYYTTDGMDSYQQTQCGGQRIREITIAESGIAAAIAHRNIQYFDINAQSSCLLIDSDMDGFADDIDCDDTNAAINPDAVEIPYNGWDDDCDALTLDDDLDQDGFLLADDCDDENELINPDATDIPNNGIDENCDGMDLILSAQNIVDSKPQFFPNPAKNKLNINANSESQYYLYLKNSKGQTLYEERFKANTILNLTNYPEGFYFLILQNENGIWTEKVIKIN